MSAKDHPTEQERQRRDDDVTETDDMSTESDPFDETIEGITAEINTIMAGSQPLNGLYAVHEGGMDYSVMSVRNGSVTYHWVQLGETYSCTCGDYHFNQDQHEREICPHIAKAIMTDRLSADEIAVQQLLNVVGTVTSAAHKAETAAESLEQARVNQLSNVPESEPETTSQSTTGSTGTDAADAAEKLQEAFDDLIDDMQVEHNDGMVWIQTGKQTPDEWPFPGGQVEGPDFMSQVERRLLYHPQQVTYVSDDHDLSDSRPGEWWKNCLDPSDVDSYISGVLE